VRFLNIRDFARLNKPHTLAILFVNVVSNMWRQECLHHQKTGISHFVIGFWKHSELYQQFNYVTLEIPSLEVAAPMMGVPVSEDGLDLTWLGDQAGWLPTSGGSKGIHQFLLCYPKLGGSGEIWWALSRNNDYHFNFFIYYFLFSIF